MDKNATLSQLAKAACQHPPGSRQRQKHLTQIIRLVNRELWRENTAYYEDALQEMWIYFCQNICEGKTAKRYDPERASVTTWLNKYLKWRLRDGYIQKERQKATKAPTQVDENQKVIDPIANLPAPSTDNSLLEKVETWVKKDPQNKLRKIYLDDYPHVTGQVLILKRLPPETPWKDLAAEYGIPAGTLSSFYQRKCKPLLREFGKYQDYI